MLVGDTAETSLVDHFGPPDCIEGNGWRFEASSTDPAAVAVSLSRDVLTTAAITLADSVRVTVKWDHAFGPLRDEFHVRVRPAPAGR